MNIRTDTALVRQIGQSFRNPARLATPDEIQTRNPRQPYRRRDRLRDEKIISNLERIFGL
jgi:hypothetical protein